MLDSEAALTFVILFCAMLGSGCKVCGKEGVVEEFNAVGCRGLDCRRSRREEVLT